MSFMNVTALRPTKIVCVGRNYLEHAKEMGNDVPKEPLLFFKPLSSIIRDGDTIVMPRVSKQVEWEGEIGVVIESRLKRVTEAEARHAIGGVVALNDVTARDLQKSDSQWTRAKGFDTFCAAGNVASVPNELDSLTVVTRVNGTERQRGHARDMVFSIPTLISYISHVMTLEPGDLIATGTPSGVGPLKAGDEVEVEILGLSRVKNSVRDEQ